MKLWTACTLSLMLALPASAAQMSADDQRALRERIEQRYDVVPLSEGIALRPRTRSGDVRLVEIADGGIAINGDAVTGRELRERLGGDADLVLRLSYLSFEDRRALFAPDGRKESMPDSPPDVKAPIPPVAESIRARNHRSTGDRVRIFGNVAVEKNEEVTGQVVAVLGSVRIDGEVGDQVVAVLGSVVLGPEAVVGGDVVSVGGGVRRSPGARIRGGVTEVSLSGLDEIGVAPWIAAWTPFHFFTSFSGIPRLIGSTFRLGLLLLLTMIALVVARPTVERSAARVSDNPVKAILVGLLAQVLLLPVLVLTVVVLSISIVGIPLLFLLPFALFLLVLMALAGFSGTACAVGQWTRRRLGITSGSAFFDVCLGVIVILLPLMLGRVLALAGWPVTPIVILLVAAGFAVELLAWSSGFGAVLTNVLSSWQARRASAAALKVPPA